MPVFVLRLLPHTDTSENVEIMSKMALRYGKGGTQTEAKEKKTRFLSEFSREKVALPSPGVFSKRLHDDILEY